jgi:Arc/MetJ family transcription regulator
MHPHRDDSESDRYNSCLRSIGKRGGRIGGKKAAENLGAAGRKQRAKKASEAATKALTPGQRKLRAKKAAEARWKGKKANAD